MNKNKTVNIYKQLNKYNLQIFIGYPFKICLQIFIVGI